MRILFVINGLGTGGAERSLVELLPRLPEAGVQATVACLFRRQEGVQALAHAEGADVRFVGGRTLAQRVAWLRRLIGEQRTDLVHTTIFESDVAGRLAAAGGPPVLTSLVNTSYDAVRLTADPNVRRWRLAVARQIDGWTARRLTAHFHAITSAVAEGAMTSLGIRRADITVIPRGRDAARLGEPSAERRLAARRALAIPEDAEVLVNVGRQEFQKAHVDLLHATAELARGRPKLVLLQAGRRGQASAAVDRASQDLRLGERVRFLGHVDDVPEVLAAGDVFVFPSIYEGLGGALIEAMALGLPIVASDLPAIREVVESGANATLVPRSAPQSLATAVAALLDDPGRRSAFAAHSRSRYLRSFTSEAVIRRTLDLYRRVATGPGAAVAS